jgi:hypothetical protein
MYLAYFVDVKNLVLRRRMIILVPLIRRIDVLEYTP